MWVNFQIERAHLGRVGVEGSDTPTDSVTGSLLLAFKDELVHACCLEDPTSGKAQTAPCQPLIKDQVS